MFKQKLYYIISLLCVSMLVIGTHSAWAKSSYNAEFSNRLVAAAVEQTQGPYVHYDSTYRTISYPNGDVSPDKGVCSDVVIRAYRRLGIDLQQRVHEDMQKHFNLYPTLWQLSAPDTNIDHRRVPNLQVFFARFGQSLPISNEGADYLPGDIVTWDINNLWRKVVKRRKEVPHIGIVSDKMSEDGKRPLLIHNIGSGVQIEDMLFDYKITGHYRYYPDQ